jgi:hypothetical protein
MNQQQELQTFLAALQQASKQAVGLRQMNVTDKSNRSEWIVGVGNQMFSLWCNPDESWGWEYYNPMQSNFGF